MSARSSQPELKPTGRDVLVALAILLLAAAVALAVYLPRRQTGQLTVVISAGGEVVQRVPLEQFPAQPLTVQSDGYTLVVTRTDTASGGGSRVCRAFRLPRAGLRPHHSHLPQRPEHCVPASQGDRYPHRRCSGCRCGAGIGGAS